MPQEYKIYRNKDSGEFKEWSFIFADDFEHAKRLFAKMIEKHLWNRKESLEWLEMKRDGKETGWYLNGKLIFSENQIKLGIHTYEENNSIYQLRNN